MHEELLGHERVGSGPRGVIVLNDWLCDTSTWDGARVYLDRERFSWLFTDLRGYGRSRTRAGEFTLREAAGDVLALMDGLGYLRCSLVGHSMSTYVAMHLSQHAPERVERVVLITPPPLRGFGADEASLKESQEVARDDIKRAEMVKQRAATRLSRGWAQLKSERFVATSDARAAAAYVAMFARDGLLDAEAPLRTPVLAITGEQDAPPMRSAAVLANLTPLCAELEVVALEQSGHYPMQEMPPLTVALIERFLDA